jgi:hypothetical protein
MTAHRVATTLFKLVALVVFLGVCFGLGRWKFSGALSLTGQPAATPADETQRDEVIAQASQRYAGQAVAFFKEQFRINYAKGLTAGVRRTMTAHFGDNWPERAAEAVAREVRPIFEEFAVGMVTELYEPGDGHSSIELKAREQAEEISGGLTDWLASKPLQVNGAIIRGLEGAGMPIPGKILSRR